MTDTVNIVNISTEHMSEMLDLLNETTLLHLKSCPDYCRYTERHEDIAYLNWILEEPDNDGYVALIDGKVAGIILFGIRKKPNNCKCGEVYYIYDVVVKESHKHMGIGRILCEKVTAKAKEKGLHQIELEVFNFNESAISFYKKQGYHNYSNVMVLDI